MGGLVPADYILGFLGRGPATRSALTGLLMGRGYAHKEAEEEAGQAILALVKCGRIEAFNGDCWRLSATTKMEAQTKETERISRG